MLIWFMQVAYCPLNSPQHPYILHKQQKSKLDNHSSKAPNDNLYRLKVT